MKRPPRRKGQHRAIRSESETARKKNALVPLRHPGEKCSCQVCDIRRMQNGTTRAALNWPSDYPPKFYEESPPEHGWEDEWALSEEREAAPNPFIKDDDPMF